MIRETAQRQQLGWEKDFRWRGGEITLLSPLEVPHTFELVEDMRGFAEEAGKLAAELKPPSAGRRDEALLRPAAGPQ